jgi:hypothetical protein
MLLTAFRLARDPHTEGHSFGYMRTLWPVNLRHQQTYTPDLGCPIELPTILSTHLIKMVELYGSNRDPVIIERLAWQIGTDLYPYRIKYFRYQEQYRPDSAVIFPLNINRIHSQLTGIDPAVTSPLDYYLHQYVFIDPYGNTEFRHEIATLCNRFRNSLSGYSEQNADPRALLEFLASLDDGRLEENVRFVTPNIVVPDPISHRFLDRHLPMRNIHFATTNPFDTSEVDPLTIHHPEVTVYSPPEFHWVAQICEQVRLEYTDVSMEFIVSDPGLLSDQKINYQISRYLDKNHGMMALHDITKIVVDTYLIARAQRPSWIRSSNDYIVTLDISFGDEVLICIFTMDRTQCVFAVHLDLAMIALCASDVIVQSV